MGKRLGFVSAAALLAGFVFGPTSVSADSLDNEIRILLSDNPELQSLRNQVEAAEEGVNVAFSGFLPSVDVAADYGYEYTDTAARRATNPGDPLSLMPNRVTATMRQRLFDGYGTQAEFGSAQISSELSSVNLQTQTQAMVLQGVTAYLNVLRAMELIDLSTRNVGVIQTQLDLETERVERGSGITLDELQAKTRLQIAQERRVAFEGTLQQATARYIRLFGHEPNLADMSLPVIPGGEIPGNLDTAIAVAIAENPQVESSELAVDLADEGRVSARSTYWPTLDLVGRLNWEDDVAGTIGIRRDAAVIVEASWQLFAGFANQAGLAQSAYQYVASVHDRTAVNRIVVRDTELAWEQLRTAQERVGLLVNAVAIAEEVHASRVRLRDAGQETVLNVLDAENEVFNAQINLVTAQYDGYIGVFRLLLAMGRLTPNRLGAETDLSSIETDVDVENYAVAASADAGTVTLATTEIEPEPFEVVAVEPVVTEPVEVEIVADNEPIAWPEPEVEAVAAAAVVTAATLEPEAEPVEGMTAALESFEAETVTAEAEVVETVAVLSEVDAPEAETIAVEEEIVVPAPAPEPEVVAVEEVLAVEEVVIETPEPEVFYVVEVVAVEEPNAVAETVQLLTADLQTTADLNLTRSWGFE